jgi:hypothetical protein
MKLGMTLALSFVFLPLAACGGSDGGEADVTPTDTVDALDTVDVTPDVPTDPGQADTEVIDNPWGFPIRLPQTHPFEYEPAWGGTEILDALDADWLCTFSHAGVSGVVYLQTTPVRVESMGLSTNPVFEGGGAWMAVDGSLAEVQNPAYDWGGNHHNEYLEFDFGGRHYKVWHSSIGPGFRVCHTPDCLQVYDLEGTLTEDGCEPTRTLPVTCSAIQADGTWEPLVDTFAPCPGEIQ